MADKPRHQFTRRRAISTVGTVATFPLIAGCMGDEGDTDTDDTNDSSDTDDADDSSDTDDADDSNDTDDADDTEGPSDEVIDRYFVTNATNDFETVQFNLFNPSNAPVGDLAQALWDPLAYLRNTELDYTSLLAEDWSHSEGEIVINLNDEYTWHDGEPVTADDVAAQIQLGEILDLAVWDYAEHVEATDDHTVTIEVEEVNPEVVWPALLQDPIHVRPDTYGQFLESWEDATTEDEENAVAEELLSFTVDEIPAGNGPFQVESDSPDEIVMGRYEDYPFADNINFAGIEFLSYPDEGQADTALIAGELDSNTHGIGEAAYEDSPDHYEFTTYPELGGHQVFFNPDSDTFGVGHRLERQAVAYLLEEENFAILLGGFGREIPQVLSGLTNAQIDQYLDDVIDDFTDYYGAQTDRAAELMEEAGYQRDDGTWYGENGEPVEAPLHFPTAWSSGIPGWEDMVEQFNDFGFESTAEGTEETTLLGTVIPERDYEIASAGQYGGVHPYENFRNSLGTFTSPVGTFTPELEEMEVPMPVGDPNGDLETINVDETIVELGQTSDQDRERELVQELAWVINQWVPYHQTVENGFAIGLNMEDWDWAGPEDPNIQVPEAAHRMQTGALWAR